MTPEIFLKIGIFVLEIIPIAAGIGWLIAGIDAPVPEETDEKRSSRVSRNNAGLVWVAAFLIAIVVGHLAATEFIGS